jgi:hypothetical protein
MECGDFGIPSGAMRALGVHVYRAPVAYPPRPQLRPLPEFARTAGPRPDPAVQARVEAFIVEHYAAGRSLRELAELTDRSFSAVRNILARTASTVAALGPRCFAIQAPDAARVTPSQVIAGRSRRTMFTRRAAKNATTCRRQDLAGAVPLQGRMSGHQCSVGPSSSSSRIEMMSSSVARRG